jgi:TPP-dependent pyruvate/acetoin dehydrogenase alpha subunit
MTVVEARSSRLSLLRDVLRIRLVEEAIAARYDEQQMRCPVHLSIGQEGVAVGVSHALELRDRVLSTHRAHAHYLAKGGDLRAMIAEIYGRATGCCGGRGGSMHLIDLAVNFLGSTPIVGSSLPVAVGTAFGAWMRDEPIVTVAYLGDGMTEEGVFSESLTFAALKSLPIVFVCENNLYSVYSPLSVRQSPQRDRVAIAAAHGMPASLGDGNDVEAVMRATTTAVARARAGGGPTYLEFETYRWREHCGPNYDNDIGYRTPEEFAAWQARDPLARLRDGVRAEGTTGADLAALEADVASEIDAAFAAAMAAPYPDPATALLGLYAEAP